MDFYRKVNIFNEIQTLTVQKTRLNILAELISYFFRKRKKYEMDLLVLQLTLLLIIFKIYFSLVNTFTLSDNISHLIFYDVSWTQYETENRWKRLCDNGCKRISACRKQFGVLKVWSLVIFILAVVMLLKSGVKQPIQHCTGCKHFNLTCYYTIL